MSGGWEASALNAAPTHEQVWAEGVLDHCLAKPCGQRESEHVTARCVRTVVRSSERDNSPSFVFVGSDFLIT